MPFNKRPFQLRHFAVKQIVFVYTIRSRYHNAGILYFNLKEKPMLIPKELRAYFSKDSFLNYPMIDIPQQFSDKRGLILNLAGGRIGDVAFIKSKKN